MTNSTSTVSQPSTGLRLAIDYGPLLVFFAVNVFGPAELMRRIVAATPIPMSALSRLEVLLLARVVVATALFMVATLVAVALSKIKLGRVSPMLLIVSVPVFIFGGLTIYFHDPKFIQMKPTFVYLTLSLVLGFGLATGRPLLQGLLGTVYPGLSAAGWRKLTVNWTVFFALLALANEVGRAFLTYDQWVFFKFPGLTIVTVIFAAANVPMLLRHGLAVEGETAAVEQLPPE